MRVRVAGCRGVATWFGPKRRSSAHQPTELQVSSSSNPQGCAAPPQRAPLCGDGSVECSRNGRSAWVAPGCKCGRPICLPRLTTTTTTPPPSLPPFLPAAGRHISLVRSSAERAPGRGAGAAACGGQHKCATAGEWAARGGGPAIAHAPPRARGGVGRGQEADGAGHMGC